MRVLLFGALALLFSCNADRIAQLEKQNKELTAKLDALTKQASLDLQERCAKQAYLAFTADKYSETDMPGYTNHYNAKLGKCFMDITTMPSHKGRDGKLVLTSFRSVRDAFELKSYAEYVWSNPEGKKYWEVAPFRCSVTLPDGKEHTCASEEGFSTLVKVYMEK